MTHDDRREVCTAADRTQSWSYRLLLLPVATDQVVGRAVVSELRLAGTLELGNDALSQRLPQLHPPLVEGVDAPDGALGEHGVLIECDQLAESLGREPLEQKGVRRTVPLEHAVWNQPVRRPLGLH